MVYNKRIILSAITLFFASSVIFLFITACEGIFPVPEPITYTIIALTGNNGDINPEGKIIVSKGEDQTFIIAPDEGYEVSEILIDGQSAGAIEEYIFTDIQQDYTIETTFKKKTYSSTVPVTPIYSITATVEAGGTIEPSGTIKLQKGESQTFTITPDEGHEIADVFIDGESIDVIEKYTFSDVQQDHTIEAIFIHVYIITATAGNNGSITPQGEITVTEGEDKTFNIIPDACYQIEEVLIDGKLIESVETYTFTDIKQNHTIELHFTLSDKKIRRYNQDGEIQQDDYTSIQDAIDDEETTDGDTIIVCPGTYRENLTFDGKNITVKSADQLNPDIVAATILNGVNGDVDGDGSGDGSVVTFINGDTSALFGFTVQNGTGTLMNTYTAGGGIYINNSNPKISFNIIENNQADHGGGIFILESPNPVIEENKIRENKCTNKGGGIYLFQSSPNISKNIISENSAGIGITDDEYGGGVYIFGGYKETFNGIYHNIIEKNQAIDDGGGVYLSGTSPEIEGNNIENNLANKDGGGICIRNDSSPNITNNNIITSNSAGQNGGGIYIKDSYGNSDNSINGNVIEANKVISAGGGFYILNSTPVINNNIIGGNFDNTGNTARWGGGICIISSGNDIYPTISNNHIKNNKANNFGGGIFINPNCVLLPQSVRPLGWGSLGDEDYRENIPVEEGENGDLIPSVEDEYEITGNVFQGNKHGDSLDYTEGAHVYFH